MHVRFIYSLDIILQWAFCSAKFEQAREAAMSVQGKTVDSQRKKSKGWLSSNLDWFGLGGLRII